MTWQYFKLQGVEVLPFPKTPWGFENQIRYYNSEWRRLIRFEKMKFGDSLLEPISAPDDIYRKSLEVNRSEEDLNQILLRINSLEAEIGSAGLDLHEFLPDESDLEFENSEYLRMLDCFKILLIHSKNNSNKLLAWQV
ncbi:MAG: hypothetical protein H6581_20895 [Bacteroidia bacterium]|nr:hypothetical protein [Bacteroidia bacterium]